MENLIDYVILAFLLIGLTGFFGLYGVGMITLRAAVNACVAVFGLSSFAIWARSQNHNGKTFPPPAGSSLHDDENDEEKRLAP